MNAKHFGDTSLGEGLGFAAVILAILLGIGCCMYLSDKGVAEKEKAKALSGQVEPKAEP